MSKTKLRVFPAISRNIDSARYIDELMRAARFSDRNGLAGILLFAGNDTLVEPWAIAQHILAHTAESDLYASIHGGQVRFVICTALPPEDLSQYDHRHRGERSPWAW